MGGNARAPPLAGLGRRTRLRARVRRVPRGSLSERGDMSVQLSDEVLVRRALELAVRGVEADPNPRVGAVIVDAAGAVVGDCRVGVPQAAPVV